MKQSLILISLAAQISCQPEVLNSTLVEINVAKNVGNDAVYPACLVAEPKLMD